MLRVALAASVILAVTLVLVPFQWLAVVLELPSRRQIPGLYHRILCALLGVRVRVLGSRSDHRPLLLVSNHVSWLDVPVISAVAPVVFVAKQEVGNWPLIGLLARLQRSIFVNRRRRHETGEVNARIARRLIEGDPVVLFGEGTSSDGNRVLPFHSALLGAARDVLAAAEHGDHVLIQPLSVAYVGLDGLPMGRRFRPVAAWYGDMELLPHLVGVLRRGVLDAVITWGEPIPYGAHTDRKMIAKALEHQVRRMTVEALRGVVAPPEAPTGGKRGPAHSGAGHSFLLEKTLRRGEGGGRREDGKAEAPTIEMYPEPERFGSTSTQRA